MSQELAKRFLTAQVNCNNLPRCQNATNRSLVGFCLVMAGFLTVAAQVNGDNGVGDTPLHLASFGGLTETARLLIAKGACVNCKNKNGGTPLMLAALGGYYEVAEVLVANGANVNEQNNDGWTALQFASSKGYLEIVRLLIAKGATVDINDNSGGTPLMLAALQNRFEVVELLMQTGANVNKQNSDGWTSLQFASCNEYLETVIILITQGATVDRKDNSGGTPLMLAALQGCQEVTNVLINTGSNVNVHNNDGWTALRLATSNAQPEIVIILLEKGAIKWVDLTVFSQASTKLHVDGQLINAYKQSCVCGGYYYTISIPDTARLLAVDATGGQYHVISIGSSIITTNLADTDWRCIRQNTAIKNWATVQYDDSNWPQAVYWNRSSPACDPTSAELIWTERDGYAPNVSPSVYCRGRTACFSSICQNGGTCINTDSTHHKCVCAPGYTGAQCQTGVFAGASDHSTPLVVPIVVTAVVAMLVMLVLIIFFALGRRIWQKSSKLSQRSCTTCSNATSLENVFKCGSSRGPHDFATVPQNSVLGAPLEYENVVLETTIYESLQREN